MFWIAGGRNSRRRSRRLAGVSSVGLAATLAFPLPAGATQCQYFDLDTNELLDRSCTVEYVGEAEVIRIGKRRLRFVESNRQGQWAVGTLDGRPATRYETNRYTFSYATLDLKLFLDRTDEWPGRSSVEVARKIRRQPREADRLPLHHTRLAPAAWHGGVRDGNRRPTLPCGRTPQGFRPARLALRSLPAPVIFGAS